MGGERMRKVTKNAFGIYGIAPKEQVLKSLAFKREKKNTQEDGLGWWLSDRVLAWLV